MQDIDCYHDLLKQVTSLRHTYQKDIAQSGGNWNLFYALGKELYHKELLHSHFLSVLLGALDGIPKNLFLRLFLEQIPLPVYSTVDISCFHTGHVQITTEKSLGRLTNQYNDGGRLDILLENKKQQIIIENKIYATDQPRQLERYHTNYPNALLIYLTLDGKKPSPESFGNLKENQYICLSYRTHILSWLEKCLTYTQTKTQHSLLHSSIAQYISLIRDLTGQGRFYYMTQQISDLLSHNESYFIAAKDIANSLSAAQNKLVQEKLLIPIKEYVQKKYAQTANFKLLYNGPFIVGFNILIPTYKKIMLSFHSEKDPICGLVFCRTQMKENDLGKIAKFIQNHFENVHGTEWWPLIYDIEPDYYFWEFSIAKSLFSNADDIVTYYEGKIDDIFHVLNQLYIHHIEI